MKPILSLALAATLVALTAAFSQAPDSVGLSSGQFSSAPEPAFGAQSTPAPAPTAVPVGFQRAVPAPAAPAPSIEVTANISSKLKAPTEQLQAIKAANQAALEKQAKTLEAIAEMQKAAEELKTFGKRS